LTLETRESHLQNESLKYRSAAKLKLSEKNRREALLLLKRAKLCDKQINQTYGQRSNLDVQIMALEGASNNLAIFNTLVAGKNALKLASAQVDVDVVNDLMEDINENIQINDEVSEALSQQLGPIVDEDELNEELVEMEKEIQEENKDQLSQISDVVPITKTPTKTEINQKLSTTPVNLSNSSLPQTSKLSKKAESGNEVNELKRVETVMGA